MGNLLYELQSYVDKLELEAVDIQKYLKHVPDGRLICNARGRKARYYHDCFDNEKGTVIRKFLHRSEDNIAEQLAYKKYYSDLLPLIQKEIRDCHLLIDDIKNRKKENVYEKLHYLRKEIIHPLYGTENYYLNSWNRIQYEPKEKDNNTGKMLKTRNGELVRSKSEKIIADELLFSDVPYKYECPLHLKGTELPIYPDFTVLNKRTGKVYYWEHLGMMDNSEYFSSVQWRLDLYARNEIFLDDKLLLSYESSHNPISTVLIEHTIEKYLL